MNTPVPEPHADDEQLSAHLDGPAEPAVSRHLAVCRRCADRLEELRAVVAALGAARALPPSVLDERASRALTAARRAWDDEHGAAPAAEGAAAAPGPAPAPASAAPSFPAGGTTPVPLAARRRRAPAWALGVAAAVALVLGATAVALQDGGSDGGDPGDFAAAPPARDTAGSPEALAAPAPAPAPAPALAPAADTANRTAEAPADQMAASGSALADLGDRRDLGELADLARRALAAPAALPTTAPCAPEAVRAAAPAPGPAGYVATLRYRGDPAVLHAFAAAAPDGSGGGRLVVMALGDCRVLGGADL